MFIFHVCFCFLKICPSNLFVYIQWVFFFIFYFIFHFLSSKWLKINLWALYESYCFTYVLVKFLCFVFVILYMPSLYPKMIFVFKIIILLLLFCFWLFIHFFYFKSCRFVWNCFSFLLLLVLTEYVTKKRKRRSIRSSPLFQFIAILCAIMNEHSILIVNCENDKIVDISF